jgi:DNA-directed RNA polymerase subunit M/transcription elongation factor TFIIS
MKFCDSCDALLQIRRIEGQPVLYCVDCNTINTKETIEKDVISIKSDSHKKKWTIDSEELYEYSNKIKKNAKALS